MKRLVRLFQRRPRVSPDAMRKAQGLKMSRDTARKLLSVAIAATTASAR